MGILYTIRNKYEVLKPKNWFVQVLCVQMTVLYVSISIEGLLREIFKKTILFSYSEFYLILISLTLVYKLYFKDKKPHLYTIRAFKYMLTITLFISSTTDRWDFMNLPAIIPVIMATIATIASLYLHTKGCLEGKKISYIMLAIQCLIVLSNIVDDLSLSVFAMILGLLLIIGAIFINKRK